MTLPIRPTHHVGTANGTRTHTGFLPPAPEAGVSAYSTIAAYKLGTPALPILQAGQLPFRTTISETLGRNKEVVAILLIVLLPPCTYSPFC